MLSAVLRNLVSNAIKYTFDKGTVSISAQAAPDQKDQIWVVVEDNGVGMDASALDSLFLVDKNTSKDGTHAEKGTGLGLILCKELIEKQGQKIWVESKLFNPDTNEASGSKFYFSLSLA